MRKLTKKALALFLTTALALALTACTEQTTSDETDSDATSQDTSTVTETTEDEDTLAEEDADLSALEALGDVEVEKDIFYVTIQLPAEFAGEGYIQADYDAIAAEKGWKSITLNEDGTLTYEMTNTQHDQMMDELKLSFQTSLDDMIASESYPNIVSIEVDENYTAFEITTTSTELSLAESFSVLSFYTMSSMYHIFNGTTVDNCNVLFINEASGESLGEGNSKDMQS